MGFGKSKHVFPLAASKKHRLNQSCTNYSELSDLQAPQLFEMDDIQVVESKPLLVDRELPVCILSRAKSNSVIIVF